ncbi:MAG: hypothetical protein K0V04_33840 [Deltaproteobacteria bacterium]|nr:hypothetical protein [Deltaproteobacteria bacterium]
MTLHAVALSNSWIRGLVYDDDEHLLNLFFDASTGLGRAKRALGELGPEVEGPQPAGAHESYHNALAAALTEAGGNGALEQQVNRMGNAHGHFQLSKTLPRRRREALAKFKGPTELTTDQCVAIARQMT